MTARLEHHRRLPKQIFIGAGAAVILIPPMAAIAPVALLAGVTVVGIAIAVYRRPNRAAYVYAALEPLVVGIDRGSFLPGVRVNEALLGFLLIVVLARYFIDSALGRVGHLRLIPIDYAVVVLAVAGSILPLAGMIIRDIPVEFLDLAYGLVLPKLAATYALFRLTVRQDTDISRVLGITIFADAIVALLGSAQALGLQPVRTLLSIYGNEDSGGTGALVRGASTIGSPLAFADIMSLSCAIVLGWVFVSKRRHWAAFVLLALFVSATFLSSQTSGFIGLFVVVLTLALVLHRVRIFAVGTGIALIIASPVIAVVFNERLSTIDPSSGLPQGWAGDAGRWNNLTHYVWPRFADIGDIILGVRLSAQIPSPYPWAQWLYIESGYTWALWAGGLPLLVSCVIFIYWLARSARRVYELGRDSGMGRTSVHVLGLTAIAATSQLAVLMVFDPHLTYRGSGDLLFALAGMAAATIMRSTATSVAASSSRIRDGIVPRMFV